MAAPADTPLVVRVAAERFPSLHHLLEWWDEEDVRGIAHMTAARLRATGIRITPAIAARVAQDAVWAALAAVDDPPSNRFRPTTPQRTTSP